MHQPFLSLTPFCSLFPHVLVSCLSIPTRGFILHSSKLLAHSNSALSVFLAMQKNTVREKHAIMPNSSPLHLRTCVYPQRSKPTSTHPSSQIVSSRLSSLAFCCRLAHPHSGVMIYPTMPIIHAADEVPTHSCYRVCLSTSTCLHTSVSSRLCLFSMQACALELTSLCYSVTSR